MIRNYNRSLMNFTEHEALHDQLTYLHLLFSGVLLVNYLIALLTTVYNEMLRAR